METAPFYRNPDLAGFPRIHVPVFNVFRTDDFVSRWPPARITISGEADNIIRARCREYGMTPRQLLEAMIHHALSGMHRPGSWEASTAFDPWSYLNDPDQPMSCISDRWFS